MGGMVAVYMMAISSEEERERIHSIVNLVVAVKMPSGVIDPPLTTPHKIDTHCFCVFSRFLLRTDSSLTPMAPPALGSSGCSAMSRGGDLESRNMWSCATLTR